MKDNEGQVFYAVMEWDEKTQREKIYQVTTAIGRETMITDDLDTLFRYHRHIRSIPPEVRKYKRIHVVSFRIWEHEEWWPTTQRSPLLGKYLTKDGNDRDTKF